MPVVIQRTDGSFKKVKLDTEYVPSPDTLQTVTDLGNTTTRDVKVENLYLNWNGLDGDSFIYFYDGASQTGKSLKWADASARFEFSSHLRVVGDINAEGNLGLNIDQGDVDAIVTFYKPTSGSQTLRWDKTNLRFKFDADLVADGDIGINSDQGNVDAVLRFYKPTTGSQTLRWDKTNNYFKFDAKLFIAGDLEVSGTIIGIATNLQEVSDNGNVTTNSLKIKNLYLAGFRTDSLITISDVGYKDNDTTPTSGGPTSWGYTAAHDANLTVEAISFSVNKDSVYIDLGTSFNVIKLRRYDNKTPDGVYGGGGFDHFAIYYSSDGTSWTLLEDFNPVTRVNSGSGYHYIEVVLASPTTARYWKIHAPENAVAAGDGTQLNTTEVEVYGNGAAAEGDSFIYIFDGGSETGKHLKWDDADARFEFSTSLYVTGDLKVHNNAYFNAQQVNADVVLNFGNGDGGNSSIYLKNSDLTFHISKPLWVDASEIQLQGQTISFNTGHGTGNVTLSFGKNPTGFATVQWDSTLAAFRFVGTDLYVDNPLIKLNHGAAAGDVELRFGKTSGTQKLIYSQANSRFEMDSGLKISGSFLTDGDITLNNDQTAADAILTFGRSGGNKTLRWDNSNSRFKFDDKLHVAGDILADGNEELNFDLTDANVSITFWKVAQSAVNTGAKHPANNTTGDATWTTPGNALVSDDAWATKGAGGSGTARFEVYNFSFPAIPFGSVITGIKVDIEGQAYGTTDAGVFNLDVLLSWDNGSSFTSAKLVSWTNTTPATGAPVGANDTTQTAGGTTDTWTGHTWVNTDFINDNFQVRLRKNSASANTSGAIDDIQVTVYYKPAASQILMWDKTNLWFNIDGPVNLQQSLAVPFNTRKQSNFTTYTLGADDFTVYADCTAGNMTITLPTAVGITGRIYVIKRKDASGNTLTLDTTSAQTIDGDTSKTAWDQYDTLMVQSDGANWIILSQIGTLS